MTKKIADLIKEHVELPERIRMLRRMALAELHHGELYDVREEGGWPGYQKAVDELREYVLKEMPSTLYVDQDEFVSEFEPDGEFVLLEDDSEVWYPPTPYTEVDRAAIARALFGELVTDGGL